MLVVLAVTLLLVSSLLTPNTAQILPYSDVLDLFRNEKVASFTLEGSSLTMQVRGDGDTTSTVTRQMAATVLLRLLRQSSTVFDADYSTLSRYPDSAAISDWAREAVAMMTQYELMNGTSKGFEPKKEMTLEQCLVLLTRICEF